MEVRVCVNDATKKHFVAVVQINPSVRASMVGLKLFVPTSMPTMRPVRYEYSGGAGGPGTTGPALPPEKSKGGEKTYKEVLKDKEDLVRKVSDADKTNEILLGQRDKIEKDLTEGRKRLQTQLDEEIKAREDVLKSAQRLKADYDSLQNKHQRLKAEKNENYARLEKAYKDLREVKENFENENKSLKEEMQILKEELSSLVSEGSDEESAGSASTGALINWL